MKHLAIATAFILAAAAARGDEPHPRYDNNLDCGYCVALELDRLATLLGDPVLKNMVCRLAFESYTPRSLGSALHIPRDQVIRRLDTLSGWGLVRTVSRNSFPTIVEPLPGSGADTLRRWALRYCPLGDVCGEPGADSEIPRDTSSENDIRMNEYGYLEKIWGEPIDGHQFGQAILRIDEINSADPVKIIDVEGETGREAIASEWRSLWLDKLAPKADKLVRIAARAMHIARWEIPRADFPQGRVGYHQWRIALAKFHAEKTAGILADLRFTRDQIDRVKDLIQKKNFKLDHDAQLLEDVASIVFFEHDFDEFATTQSEENLLNMIKKTWHKMSAQGRESVRNLELSTSSRKLVDTALRNEGEVKY